MPPGPKARAVHSADAQGRPDAPPSNRLASTSQVRVRYAETDKMGVAYYANYLVWFEVGRADFLRNLGADYRSLAQEGVLMPVIEAHCEYRQPARYDDLLEIRTRGSIVSPLRVAFTYEIVRPADGVLAATGRTVHASVDPAGRPTRLPPRLLTLFTCTPS